VYRRTTVEHRVDIAPATHGAVVSALLFRCVLFLPTLGSSLCGNQAKMVTNHRGTVLELGMLSMIPIIALVAVVVYSTSRLLWITAESDKLKHSKRKVSERCSESCEQRVWRKWCVYCY
jgi:hypothetical protein